MAEQLKPRQHIRARVFDRFGLSWRLACARLRRKPRRRRGLGRATKQRKPPPHAGAINFGRGRFVIGGWRCTFCVPNTVATRQRHSPRCARVWGAVLMARPPEAFAAAIDKAAEWALIQRRAQQKGMLKPRHAASCVAWLLASAWPATRTRLCTKRPTAGGLARPSHSPARAMNFGNQTMPTRAVC